MFASVCFHVHLNFVCVCVYSDSLCVFEAHYCMYTRVCVCVCVLRVCFCIHNECVHVELLHAVYVCVCVYVRKHSTRVCVTRSFLFLYV